MRRFHFSVTFPPAISLACRDGSGLLPNRWKYGLESTFLKKSRVYKFTGCQIVANTLSRVNGKVIDSVKLFTGQEYEVNSRIGIK
jgi:hypothetical protein